jgi:putative iron-dependent peroxidase
VTPQHGIFAVGTRSHHHLQLDLTASASSAALLDALAEVRARATTVAGVNIVIGFGARLCAALAPELLPRDLEPFAEIRGADGLVFPADQHDLWVWLHASGPDATFDMARHTARCLDPVAQVVSEQPCFTYLSSQDLTGFEDGTENPPLDEAFTSAVVPAGHPGAGGSVVLVQRWVHDLRGFEQLSSADQDQVIGRSKATREEIPDRKRSKRSHISRVVIEDERGEELQVFRRSVAFGGVQEHGLQFVAFSPDVARLRRMLERMAGIGDGVRDRLTDFSASTGGAWYVAPPIEAFQR